MVRDVSATVKAHQGRTARELSTFRQDKALHMACKARSSYALLLDVTNVLISDQKSVANNGLESLIDR